MAVLGRSWALCWLSWGLCRRSWAALGAYVGSLGRSWGLCWQSWAALGAHVGDPRPSWDLCWRSWATLRAYVGGLGSLLVTRIDVSKNIEKHVGFLGRSWLVLWRSWVVLGAKLGGRGGQNHCFSLGFSLFLRASPFPAARTFRRAPRGGGGKRRAGWARGGVGTWARAEGVGGMRRVRRPYYIQCNTLFG